MNEISWNKKQQAAIDARDKGIVVSAAAGSGKTAVLVERILNRVCDEEDPASFERFLMVTFTKAASREMNQRLRKKLNERIAENPGNKHIVAQKRLLPLANISSIDSFYFSLVKDNFHRLGITPDFTIIDPGEGKMLIEESFDEAADLFYEESKPEFLALNEIIGGDDDGMTLSKIAKKLNEYAESHVNPEKWLDSIAENYAGGLPVWETEYGKTVLAHLDDCAKYALKLYEKGLEYVEGADEYQKVYDLLLSEKELTKKLLTLIHDAKWDELKHTCDNLKFGRFPTTSIAEELRTTEEFCAAKTLRSKAKSYIDFFGSFMAVDSEQYKADCERQAPVMHELIRFVKEFRRIYSEKKAQKNVYDFDDITHLALKLLVDGDGNPTEVAREISRRYEEILIDEYQDTNEAQDTIFKAISKDCTNLFLVGDVKQSVYGFRLATPYMFIDKIKTWKEKSVTYADYISLDKNYRSREAVLNCINYIFSQTMSEDVGDIKYEGDELLAYGSEYPDADGTRVEIDMIVKSSDDTENVPETVFIARRIKELIRTEKVYDKKNKVFRPLRLRDICVLCRTNSLCSKFAAALNNEGVSAYFTVRSGFFDFLEIRTVLSFLQILDNPLQDVPLLAVMSSPLFGFSPDELAQIRIATPEGKLFYAVRNYDSEKCRNFIRSYNDYRSLASMLSVSALIREIYERTGYYTVAGALTNGEFRQMNLMLLLEYSDSYGQYSTGGLAGFVRYLERCRDLETEFEPAAAVSESADVVQVMTVHKSKGLEFPVVILANASYITKSSGDMLIVDETVGAGLKICEKKKFKSYPTVQHAAASIMNKKRERSEELRLLYVALTRAMERLIITFETSMTNEMNVIEERFLEFGPSGLFKGVEPLEVLNANNFIKVILHALVNHPDCAVMRDISPFRIKSDGEKSFSLDFNIIDEPLVKEEQEEKEIIYAEPDEKTVELIRERADYVYPYASLSSLATKKSASSFNDDSLEAGEYFALDVPQFARDGAMTGAQRGTAMHRFMEVCDFESAKADTAAERDRLVAEKLLTPEQGEVLDTEALAKFFESDVYSRIAKSPRVMREQKFTVFVPASFVNPELGDAAKDEKVLVQGVIDCAFFENGKTVVLDYKTDRVSEAGQLAGLYHRQLEVYKIAAEECFGTDVSELLLYSFALGEEVKL